MYICMYQVHAGCNTCFLEITLVRDVSMHVCLCVSAPEAINNYSHEITDTMVYILPYGYETNKHHLVSCPLMNLKSEQCKVLKSTIIETLRTGENMAYYRK